MIDYKKKYLKYKTKYVALRRQYGGAADGDDDKRTKLLSKIDEKVNQIKMSLFLRQQPIVSFCRQK